MPVIPRPRLVWTCFSVLLALFCLEDAGIADERPNIVVVLCDDLGYGDVQPLNRESKIPTPAFNRLAAEGMAFTDAHSPSAVCTPTRYGILCGRYCWRTRLKRGVLGGYSRPLIDRDQPTIASVLKSAGYRTACVGKWHLGLGWAWKDEAPSNINNFGIAGRPGMIDDTRMLTDSPQDHGFDRSFIIPASLDMSPYVYVENGRVATPIKGTIPGSRFPAFYRKGEIGEGFSIPECLDRVTDYAANVIRQHDRSTGPLFLYVPLPSPHKPVMPSAKFAGSTGLGPYGDYVAQVDGSIDTIMQAIDDTAEPDNTLLVVTSDNGSFMYRSRDPNAPDHTQDPSVQAYYQDHHLPNAWWRGTKADIWEAGHRVPFFVRWPAAVDGNQTCRMPIGLVDLLATCAVVAGAEYDAAKAEDSFTFAPMLTDPTCGDWHRPALILHSAGGMFAVRKDDWKLILGNGSGGRERPAGQPFALPYRLVNLSEDAQETTNWLDRNPEMADALWEEFQVLAHGDQWKPPR